MFGFYFRVVLFLAVLSLFPGKVHSQYNKRCGVVAQYIVELDSSGNIDASNMYLPFSSNVQYHIKKTPHKQLNTKEMAELLTTAHKAPSEEKKIKLNKGKEKIVFVRTKEQVKLMSQVHYLDKKGKWHTLNLGGTIKFNVLENGKLSLDTVSPKQESESLGYTYVYSKTKEEYYGYHLEKNTASISKRGRYLLFINGYRGPKREDDPSRNEVALKDMTNYWNKLDLRFDSVLQPKARYYLDGSFSVKTSNHKSNVAFAWSYLRVRLSKNKLKKRNKYNLLNQKINKSGFEYRKNQGKFAVYSFESILKEGNKKTGLQKDTIDIVCHSMGYAYMLGLMEELVNRYVFGKIYIIAPESGSYMGYDWNTVEEVWQYGSNLGTQSADPVWEQDGVAPQSTVKGIEALNREKGGRIFYPWNWTRKNFVDSHMTYNFNWIFDELKKGEPGFIEK